jgi:hypothetical protein
MRRPSFLGGLPTDPQARARAAQDAREGKTEASRRRRAAHRARVTRDGDGAGIKFRRRRDDDG